MVLRDFLPPALRGLMVAAFLAAFMSTVGTQLNWGCSYLVNDLYKRFLVRNSTEQHYVRVSRVITVLLVLASGYTAAQLKSIGAGMGTGAGRGFRHWRSLHSALVLVANQRLERNLRHDRRRRGHHRFAQCFLRRQRRAGVRQENSDHRRPHDHCLAGSHIRDSRPKKTRPWLAFYRRVHPTVYGWKRVAKLAPELPEVKDVAGNAFNWLMGVILVYGCLFGIGKLVFQQWGQGILLLAIAAIAGYLIFWDLSRRGWETLSGKVPDSSSTNRQHRLSDN